MTSAARKAPAQPAASSKVVRFSLASRIGHWSHALTFLVLLVTGLALVFKGIVGVSALKTFGQLHRLAAWPFTFVAFFVLLLGARKAVGAWLSSIVKFDADDRRFLALFWREFFGLKVNLPPQGKFNGGEKINSLLQVTGWAVMVATGWMLVYKEKFPEAFPWILAIHSFCAMMLGAAALGHIYLAAGHPHSRVALSGMISGLVPRSWARGHHKKWADGIQD
ncbi:MAG TPA: cytochrome b/b6 domain-containing protein [Symbiobacteriaceae bacterium]|nr:cytochrome b/b6 domain-containing protein [Symbiobacteriaceae bacterium]